MKIRPSLEEAKVIAESGKYDVLPVSCEILSDFITPIEAIRILKNVSTHCYMLESAQANETWLLMWVLCESIRKPVKFKLLCVFLQPARQHRIRRAQSDFSGIWF